MVSVIIVNYNAGELLRRCVDSLYSYVKIPFEVIIVDNASSDESLNALDGFKGLTIVRELTNWGFPKACNIGARRAKYDLFYFLNPDAEVREDINDALDSALRSNRRIVHATRIRNDAGVYKPSFLLPVFSNLLRLLFAPDQVVRWYIGASIIIHKEAYWELGGFSEDYFIYGDDIDFFYKAYLAGMVSAQSPATIIHNQGGCSQKVWSDIERLRRVESSASIFRQKFKVSTSYFVFKHLAFLRGLSRSPAKSFCEIRVYWEELLSPRPNRSL